MTTTRETALERAAKSALGYLTGNMDGDLRDDDDPVELLRAALSTPSTEPQGYVEGLEAALRFYGAISRYPAPLTGGMGDLWHDCGEMARKALAARPDPQPAADTRVVVKPLDLIHRDDAVAACQVGPSDEWAKATKDGYNQAAIDCAMNILRIIPATPAPSDKIADAADMDVFGARRVIDAYDAANPFRTADMHPAACHCHRCAIDWLRALAGQGETP